MEEQLFFDSVDEAVSRGDVETLIVLWKDTEASENKEERQDYINSVVFDLAERLHLPSERTLKDFVTKVYDPEQARRAFYEEDAVDFLERGGLVRARNMAKVLYNALLEKFTPEYLGMVLYYILLKLNGEHNEYIGKLLAADFDFLHSGRSNENYYRKGHVEDLLRNLINAVRELSQKKGNWKPFVELLAYEPKRKYLATSAGVGEIALPFVMSDPNFFETYLRRFYPQQKLEAVRKVVQFLSTRPGMGLKPVIASIINTVTEMNNISDREKEDLVRQLLSAGVNKWDLASVRIKDPYIVSYIRENRH